MRHGPMRVEPRDEVGEDAAIPGFEGLDLLLEVAGMAGFVGGLDVDEEQVGAGIERVAARRRACPRSSCRTSRWRRAPRRRSMPVSTPSPRTRSTAVTRPARQPVCSENLGIWGWNPWPQSHTWLAPSPKPGTISRLASMIAWSLAAAAPVGHTAGLSERSWGGVHSASAQSAGATRMWRYWTPGWNSMSAPHPGRAARRGPR